MIKNNINFNEIKYERLDYDKTKKSVEELISKLIKCDNYNEYLELVKEIIKFQNHIEEMFDYADINNMRNVEDKFFGAEIKYWNENKVKYDSLFLPFYNELNNSKYKEELKGILPDNFFRIIEYQARVTSDEISDLVAKENDLMMQCRKLNLTKLNYDGEEKTIGKISADYSNKDREVRKKAHDFVNDYYYSNQEKYDQILFELVQVRNEIARKLGFKNCVEYSIYKLKRFDYDYSDISKFRDNIIKYIIPICKQLTEWKKEELGLDELKYYDTVYFTEMPKPKYEGIELLEHLRDSFKEVDKELSDLYDFMLENGYIDFVTRDTKVNFSITNYLTETCMPVVTGNYKGTYFDVKTTTHEIGHSLQKYCASKEDKNRIVSALLKYPTMEVAEIFSYAMEFIMMDHLDNIFSEEDYKKYCFMKMYNFITDLPQRCLVDEFQQAIYSKEDLKVEDIRKTWLELAHKYNMDNTYGGHINLSTGGSFYGVSHIYYNPFYFIDYALACCDALSIWNECDKNIDLFKEIGGVASYYSFKELIEKYNMPNPFEEDTVKEVSIKLQKELENKRIVK
jgi:M3 family oligoendopeptidase